MATIVVCKECGKEKPHHAHGLCKSCYTRQWRVANPEYNRQWREANQAHIQEYDRQYKEAHREERRESTRSYRAEHPEWDREYRKANPEKGREKKRRYRARKNGAAIGPVDEAAIYERDGHMCLYCGRTRDLTIDHIIALNNDGPHCQDNLVVACRSCNSSKQAKPLEEWLQTQPKALAWVI